MKMKREKMSDRIEQELLINPVNRKGMGHKTVAGGKGNRNYGVTSNKQGKGNRKDWEHEMVMGGMKDASEALHDFMKGKKDREPGPESPLTEFLKRKYKR